MGAKSLLCTPHFGATVAPEQLIAEGGTKSTQCCGNSAGETSAFLCMLHFSLLLHYISKKF